MLTPPSNLPLVAACCIVVALFVFPINMKGILHWRWLTFMLILSLPPIFYLGEIDRSFLGIPISSEGLIAGIQIALRFIVVLLAVNGLTRSVEITAIAGILERFGLQGLGFSMGVALNLLPSLQQSSLNAWHSLWMRGGLRQQRWRGIRLLLLSIITNSIRRAEEIALAAEARAFSPERSRPMPITIGSWDWVAKLFSIGSIVTVLILK